MMRFRIIFSIITGEVTAVIGTQKNIKILNYVLEKISLSQKLDFVVRIRPSWKKYESGVRQVNELRNPLAHSFFPEKRIKKPIYRGQDVFSVIGLTSLENDMQEMVKNVKKLA